ncbi:MAG: hypothetical protein ACP5F3_08175 [Candidatus Syntrophosphaera sp.]
MKILSLYVRSQSSEDFREFTLINEPNFVSFNLGKGKSMLMKTDATNVNLNQTIIQFKEGTTIIVKYQVAGDKNKSLTIDCLKDCLVVNGEKLDSTELAYRKIVDILETDMS